MINRGIFLLQEKATSTSAVAAAVAAARARVELEADSMSSGIVFNYDETDNSEVHGEKKMIVFTRSMAYAISKYKRQKLRLVVVLRKLEIRLDEKFASYL